MDSPRRFDLSGDHFVGEAVTFMNIQEFYNIGLGIIVAGIGWFARELWGAVAALREDIHKIEREMPVIYVRRDDFADAMRRIEDMLNKISDKLDGKVDKNHG